MMISHPLASWWRGDRKIICLFAMYGLAAGTMMYVGGVLYDQQQNFVAIIGFLLNIPALIIMTWLGGYFASPYGYSILFDPVIVIPYSAMTWSFIGLTVYSLVKMFRMGP